MIDPVAVLAATGWTAYAHPVVASTNDEAARLRDAGAPPRTVVVADAQTAGRGRGGRAFASPRGGLYASLLLDARHAAEPGPLTAALAVAGAEAVEDETGLRVAVKWPNDLWIGGRKVAGLLLEASGAGRPVVAGIGVNVDAVPADLPDDVRATTTALALEAGRRTDVGALLVALLRRVDRRLADLGDPSARAGVEAAWRARLALRGERVRYRLGGAARAGRFLDASWQEGLLVEDEGEGRVRRRAEHVQDLRPA